MTKSELIEKIDKGSDIMFDVCGKHYTIFTWCEEGIFVGEHHCTPTRESFFKTAQDLVENFRVNGVPLGELAAGIRITEYS